METLKAYNIIESINISPEEAKIKLLDFFIKEKPSNWNSIFSINDLLNKLSYDQLVELIGIFHQKSKEQKKIEQTNERKHFGIYYTNYHLARFIVRETLNLNRVDPTKATFLEPCCGSGNFVIAYLDEILSKQKKISNNLVQKIINNIYCADIDEGAIDIIKKIIPQYLKKKYAVSINIPEKNYFSGDLLFLIKDGTILKNDPKKIFRSPDGFDIVITNPPYKLLKANSNKYGDGKNKKAIENIINYIRKEKIYPLNEGTLNYYKLFVEEIIVNYTNKNSIIGLLIPRTILNDKQSEKLRNYILANNKLSTIYNIPEKNNFFPDVAQSFCFFSVDRSKKGEEISIVDEVSNNEDLKKKPISISISQTKEISSSIIVESNIGIGILKKIHANPKLASLSHIANLRGELDLTLHKKFIAESPTKYRLIKGINVKEFSIEEPNNYVSNDFIGSINGKHHYVINSRIVCQQISNINSSKRLKFAFVQPNYILGNSCNFIALQTSNSLFKAKDVSLYYLLGILNSFLMDWRFRLSNSNNHVSNYELNELPIVVNGDKGIIDKIERISKDLIKKHDDGLMREMNDLTLKLYGLNSQETAYINSRYARI